MGEKERQQTPEPGNLNVNKKNVEITESLLQGRQTPLPPFACNMTPGLVLVVGIVFNRSESINLVEDNQDEYYIRVVMHS